MCSCNSYDRHVILVMVVLFQLVMINACLSRLERDTQDHHRQKQEISKQINTRHELLTFWADNARDEVGILYIIRELSRRERSDRH